MSQEGIERRRFHRIATDKTVVLSVADTEITGTVLDISLRGLLVSCDASELPGKGASARAHIKLEGDAHSIDLDGEIAHVSGQRIGLCCTGMDLESAARLRRMVELNLDDPTLLERDLTELMSGSN